MLGGTQFVGRRMVEAALSRGHSVTLFHRGKTNPGLFPEAEQILGAFRPVAEIIRETLEWDAAHGRRDVGLTRERERELLNEWDRSKTAV